MQLSDREINILCQRDTKDWQSRRMITPFTDTSESPMLGDKKLPSYGLSSYGYDVRVGNSFKLLKPQEICGGRPISPIDNNDDDYVDIEATDGCLTIPPHGFVLGHTREYFRIPRKVLVVCMGKSTYARLGLIVNVTPLEPEWEGNVVIEISNTTNRAVKIFTEGGIAQFIFFWNERGCETSYADRKGKYQGQRGVTTAR